MADAVTVNIIVDTPTHTLVHLTGISDGTGETNVKKVDIAALCKTRNGQQPTGLRVGFARWSMYGWNNIKLGWDRTAAQNTAMVPTTSGYADYRGRDGFFSLIPEVPDLTGLEDPSEGNSDAKGSILLSTIGTPTSGFTYDIDLLLIKGGN